MVVVAGCLVIKDNKVLMVQEKKEICYGKWNTPGGKVEKGEKITDAAVREVFEETGCKIKITGVLPFCKKSIPQMDEDFLLIRFVGEIIEENLKITNPKEIMKAKWIDLGELKNMPIENFRGPDIIQAIKNFEENRIYPLDIFEDKIEGKN